LGALLFFSLRALGVAGFPGLAIATSAAAWLNVGLMVRSLIRRGAYGPGASAFSRLIRILAASAILWAVMLGAYANRAALESALGSKEAAVATLILAGGIFYFALVFAFRAVTFGEVRAAFRRERGSAGGGGGLPPGVDG
jgi:putative peptidoglycan lipid II flippase